jgi:hypothetical protein
LTGNNEFATNGKHPTHSRKAAPMPVLNDYAHFGHVHWETGTLANVLAYAMDDPISEAVLFGTSGGIVAGYAAVEAETPHLHFLTRNTFFPLDTIIERLKLPTDERRTSHPEKARSYLSEALDDGSPTIVWADMSELPYTVLASDTDDGLMLPIVVYGYENGTAQIADRASVPFTIPAEALEVARAKVPAERHRQMTVGVPNTARLALAVRLGIEACLRHFLEEPPLKEMRGMFGLAAFEHWAAALESRSESGWRSAYPPGQKLYTMLTSAYYSINLWGTGGHGSRGMFADFLDEAADLLDKPALKDNAEMWREVVSEWEVLNDALLPDDVAPLAQARQLMEREYNLFKSKGAASIAERKQIRGQLDTLKTEMRKNFPLKKRETYALLDNLRDCVLAIHGADSTAVHDLKEALMAVRA